MYSINDRAHVFGINLYVKIWLIKKFMFKAS